MFYRPGVAGAVQQTSPSFIHLVTDPYPPDLQNIINPKPLRGYT